MESTAFSACDLPPKVGSDCGDQGILDRYYFDGDHSQCRYFTYGGCGGNANNFASMQQCESLCVPAAKSVADSSLFQSFRWFHIVGFAIVMIFAVLILCLVAYCFKRRQSNKRSEPPQYQQVNTDNRDHDQQIRWKKGNYLYIQNISTKCKAAVFELLLKGYGEIANFEFHRKENVCFVEYKSKEDGDRALLSLNGHCVEDRKISVQYAMRDRATTVSEPPADKNRTEKQVQLPQNTREQRGERLQKQMAVEIKVAEVTEEQHKHKPPSMHGIPEKKALDAESDANQIELKDLNSGMSQFDSDFDEFATVARHQRLSIAEEFRQGYSNSMVFEDEDLAGDDANASLSELHNFVRRKLTTDEEDLPAAQVLIDGRTEDDSDK